MKQVWVGVHVCFFCVETTVNFRFSSNYYNFQRFYSVSHGLPSMNIFGKQAIRRFLEQYGLQRITRMP